MKLHNGALRAEDFTEEEKQTVLASWKGAKTTLQDILDMYGKNLRRSAERLRNKGEFKRNVENLSIQTMIVAEAEKKGYDQEEDVRDQLDNFLEQRMITLLNQNEVNDKVTIEDSDIEKYYEEHKEEFSEPAEIMVWEIFVKDETLANKVLNLAEKGRDFEALATKYSEDKFYQKKKGKLGYKQINSRKAVSRKAFEVGPNQIAGPVKYKEGWAVIKTGDKKPEQIQSFEEVKARVKSKVRAQRVKDRKEEWEQQLKEEYAVSINEQLVEQI
jgi:parvulin-like peptidyl-prolyl isomerase